MAESSIYQLPTEMVDLVAEHLSLLDICNFRLTCKQFEAALLETFAAHLHARISDPGGFVIARPSLEHLVQLTQQVRLRLHKVQSFSIAPARFDKDILRRLQAGVAATDPEDTAAALIAHHRVTAYREHLLDQCSLEFDDADVQMLATALSNLPGLQEFHLLSPAWPNEEGRVPKTWHWDQVVLGIGDDHSLWCLPEWTGFSSHELCLHEHSVLSVVLKALSRSQARFRTIVANLSNIDVFRRPLEDQSIVEQTAFTENLQSLADLTIIILTLPAEERSGQQGMQHMVTAQYSTNRSWIGDLIVAASNLERLHLRFN